MKTIKAIETRYAGYRFRSRTEARWAVALNASGLCTWEYEPEGFNLGGIYYLPDFRVWWSSCDYSWIEVKPDNYQPTAHDNQMYQAMATETQGGLVLLRGVGRGYRTYQPKKPPVDIPDYFLGPEAIVAARSARFEHGERG